MPRTICDLFVKQEKRKKSNILANELAEGDEEEEHGGHGGPELQRTGRWITRETTNTQFFGCDHQ